MPDAARLVAVLCWAIAGVASLIITVPQATLLLRTALRRDELWWFRVKTTLLFGSLGTALLWNVAIWADYALFGQRYLGTIEQRWPLDLAMSATIMVACVFAAILYLQTQRETRP